MHVILKGFDYADSEFEVHFLIWAEPWEAPPHLPHVIQLPHQLAPRCNLQRGASWWGKWGGA